MKTRADSSASLEKVASPPGYDADLSLVDLSARRVIENTWIAGTNAWTPFDGMKACGWPVATVIRGFPVMREGEIISSPRGEPLRFDLVAGREQGAPIG